MYGFAITALLHLEKKSLDHVNTEPRRHSIISSCCFINWAHTRLITCETTAPTSSKVNIAHAIAACTSCSQASLDKKKTHRKVRGSFGKTQIPSVLPGYPMFFCPSLKALLLNEWGKKKKKTVNLHITAYFSKPISSGLMTSGLSYYVETEPLSEVWHEANQHWSP